MINENIEIKSLELFKEIEKLISLAPPNKKRNYAIVNTELEKAFAYYKTFCE